ncbi:PP2C family protein-serine/threonine phosphatase [Demequina lutea]|uniref:Protein phosphatase n=1 Tax=Demequina lutea TaxID=431489 RepID=A0A7Z0CG44_9MICO|nr:protein phosphatase 2C domain-containing protein [Demequina lutea]NYI39991.1 protein phosphatase [Demequina lutea]
MFLTLRFAARSDVGLVRADNQDSGFAGPHLIAVADGMGGAAGGDIASSIAMGHLAALEGEGLGQDESLDRLKEAIADAHADIVERAHNDPELSGLGTTVTAILRSGSSLAMAHIGDSRGYLLRDGVLDQVTSDHTFVQHLVDTGRLSQADAENHPKRNLVLRVLGDIDADVPVDISVREARVDDRWMLCSDGLSGVVSRATMLTTLSEVEDPGDCADALVALALAAGAPDNVTCIIGDVVDIDNPQGAKAKAAPNEIVGSAARDRKRPTQGSESSAGRAAKLSSAPADDDEEEERTGRWSRIKPWLLPVAALLVVVAALWGGYAWTQTQYYVGSDTQHVVIYKGIPQTLGPISLHSVAEVTDLSVSKITGSYDQARLDSGLRTDSLAAARKIVAQLTVDYP